MRWQYEPATVPPGQAATCTTTTRRAYSVSALGITSWPIRIAILVAILLAALLALSVRGPLGRLFHRAVRGSRGYALASHASLSYVRLLARSKTSGRRRPFRIEARGERGQLLFCSS